MPISQLGDVTSALNFDSAELRVEGGCDLYTTKACGSDKKLYKDIEHDLENKYVTLLRAQSSEDPREAADAAQSMKLARSSAFGPMSSVSSRRTFAYLIATLNASHPDYEFFGELKPTDFIRLRNLRQLMNTFDTMLYNLRPKPPVSYGSPHWSSAVTPAGAIVPTQKWSPKMWRLIDEEMHLAECTIYSLSRDAELYDEEERVIWNYNYFFFNKSKRRVCYLYLKGMSILNEDFVPNTPLSDSKSSPSGSEWVDETIAGKRAGYWFHDRPSNIKVAAAWDEDDEEEMLSASHYHDNEDGRLLPRLEHRKYALSRPPTVSPGLHRSKSRSTARGISEDVVQSMEV